MLEQYPLEIFTHEECPQNSETWHALRAGLPTASEFHTILAKGKGGGESKTRRTYLYKLAAEVITGEVSQTFVGNVHTERGHELEPEARERYAFINDIEPTQVGFIRRGPVGCSPDSLLGEHGILEIKTRLPHLQLELLETRELPSEHKAQCQGLLWVSGRRWLDYFSYSSPKLPHVQIRVERDPAYIAGLVRATMDFLEELNDLVGRFSLNREAA